MPTTAPVVIKPDRLIDLLRKNEYIKEYDGLVIEGDLDLRGITFDHRLVLRNCTIKGQFDARDAHFKRSVDLTGCTFENKVNLNGVRAGGSLTLAGCTFKDNLRLAQAHIDGNLLLGEAAIHTGSEEGRSANLELLDLGGNLRLEGLLCEPSLNLIYARVRGRVYGSVQGDRPLTCSGTVDLQGAQVGGEVDFDGCQIEGNLDLQEATVGGCFSCTVMAGHAPHIGADLRLPGARVSGQVALQGARVDGDLVLSSAEVRCGLQLGSLSDHPTEIGGTAYLAAVRVAVTLNASGAHIGGNLNLLGAVLDGELIANGIAVGPREPATPEAAADGGHVFLGEARVTNEVSFDDAHIGADLNLVGATVRGYLHGQRMHVGQNLTLNGARVSVGALFSGAQIGGNFTLIGTVVEGELICAGIQVGDSSAPPPATGEPAADRGNVRMAEAQVLRELSFIEANIAGELNLVGIVVNGLLFAQKARVGGNVHLAGSKLALAVVLSEIRIGGFLSLAGAVVDGELHCDGIEVGNVEGLSLEAGPPLQSSQAGQVVLADAKVTKDANFNHARIASGLHFDCAVLNSILHCRQVHIGGDLTLPMASLGWAFLNGAQVRGDLDLRSTEIKGNLILSPSDEAQRTTIKGEARLTSTRINGNLNLMGARFRKSLSLERAVIQGKLRVTFRGEVRTEVVGQLNLETCSVGHANFDDEYHETDDWQPPPRKSVARMQWSQVPALRLRAFRFDTLTLPDRNYVEFLARSRDFTASTYVFFEKHLRSRGDRETANRVYLAMRDRQRQKNYELRAGYFRPFARLYDWFSDFFITWAIRSYRLFLLYLVVILVLTAWLFSDPRAVSLKTARSAELSHRQKEEVNAAHTESWTTMKAILMSLQVNLPMIPIAAVDSWQPSQEPLAVPAFRVGTDARKIEYSGATISSLTYQEYASLVSLFTTFVALPLLGGGLWTKLSRERAVDAA